MSEYQFHAAAVQFLKVALPREAVLHHSPNEGKRGWRSQKSLKDHGTMAGWPDLEIIYGGKAYFIELKGDGKHLTTAQKIAHDALRWAGCDCVVARSLEQIEVFIQLWNIPLSANLMAGGLSWKQISSAGMPPIRAMSPVAPPKKPSPRR